MTHSTAPWYWEEDINQLLSKDGAVMACEVMPNKIDRHLIAASPDLLEACKHIFGLLTGYPPITVDRRADALKMLESAIAKADPTHRDQVS